MAAAAFKWSFKTLLSSGVISFLYLASFSFSHMPPISSNTYCVSEMLPIAIEVEVKTAIKQNTLKSLNILIFDFLSLYF